MKTHVRVFRRAEGLDASEGPHVLDAVTKRNLVLLLHDDAAAGTKATATATGLATRIAAIGGVHHLMQNFSGTSCSKKRRRIQEKKRVRRDVTTRRDAPRQGWHQDSKRRPKPEQPMVWSMSRKRVALSKSAVGVN